MPIASVTTAASAPPRQRISPRVANRTWENIFVSGCRDFDGKAGSQQLPCRPPEVAGTLDRRQMPGGDFAERRAPVERGGIQDDAAARRVRVGDRDGREQRAGVGMLRRGE